MELTNILLSTLIGIISSIALIYWKELKELRKDITTVLVASTENKDGLKATNKTVDQHKDTLQQHDKLLQNHEHRLIKLEK